MIKKALGMLLAGMLAIGCVVGCSASKQTSGLNTSLETLGKMAKGTITVMNLMDGKETLSEKKTFQSNDGNIEFVAETTDPAETYEYKDGKIVLPEGKLPSATFDTSMQFENLSQLAGIDLDQIDENDLESVKQTMDGAQTLYEVIMRDDTGVKTKGDPVVWVPKYRRYLADSHGNIVRIEAGDTPEYVMAVVIEK